MPLSDYKIGRSNPASLGSGKSCVLDSIFLADLSELIDNGVLPLGFSFLFVNTLKDNIPKIVESRMVIGIIHPVPAVVDTPAAAASIMTAPSKRIPLELLATTITRTKVLMNLAHTGP
jgi:hypothetical protein